MNAHQAIVVGAGQAGLAASHELTRAGIEHIVLERDRIGATWRRLWDSFHLVLPNWSVQLPGHPYDGDDPDGFMPRDAVVSYLERYAAAIGAPVREGVDVTSVSSGETGGFVLETSAGTFHTPSLLLATGAFQQPHRPAEAEALPPHLLALNASDYRNPDMLPPGDVLIVGSGQSGCQIAEEINRSGRHVVLACGRAPWAPRRIGGRDFLWWAVEAGLLDETMEDLPGPAARLVSNPLVTGSGGGRDLNLRTLHADGVALAGRFRGYADGRMRFARDLADSIAWGDERYNELMARFRAVAARKGLDFPDMPIPGPLSIEAPTELDPADFGTVVFATGFRPGYAGWLPWPHAFDDHGFPKQVDGASTEVDGLYFLGVHFLRKRKSALLMGVGEDAALVAQAIAERAR